MAKKILVVDDEPDMVNLLKIRLKSNGYDVLTARDGEDCLRKAAKEMPDLVLLDILLPDINGFEVCGRLKKDAKTKNIPVVMITVLAQEKDLCKGLEEGADCFLTKPFNPVDLLDEIKQTLAKKQ